MATIDERYHELHPTSRKLYEERAQKLLPDGVTHDTRYVTPFPIFATHGMGPRKWDVDGNELVDYVCGHGSLILGHSHPAVVSAVTNQIDKGTHLGASTELEIRWAEWITKLIPSAEKVRFTSSGTEATMMAFRLARAYTGKSKVIKFHDHFHGWNDYAMATGGVSGPGIPELVWKTMIVLEPNDISLVEKVLGEDDDVAAIIVEPTGAHMGVSPVYQAFLEELRETTRRHGTVLIFDEVVTGFRTSPGGAQARFGVTPDMTTLGKIVAGGLPGAAVAGQAKILDMLQHRNPQWDTAHRVYHPGTFNANPLTSAAGATALELVGTTSVNAKAEAMAQRLKDGVNQVLARLEIPGCANGVASTVHITLGIPHECDGEVCKLSHEQIRSMPAEQVRGLKRALINAGVDPMGGRTLLVSGVHQEQDVDFTVGAYEEALTALRDEGGI